MDNEYIEMMETAVESGDINTVEFIIKENRDVLFEKTVLGNWLAISIDENQIEMLKFLLSQGLDIHEKSGIPETTCIELAVQNQNVEIVQILLSEGAGVDDESNGIPLLFRAIRTGNLDIVKLLIDRGADISNIVSINSEKLNPAGYARQKGKTVIAEFIESLSESAKSNYIEKVPHTVSFRRSKIGINFEKLEEFFQKAIRESFPKIKQKYQDDHLIKISYAFDTKSTDVNYRYICDICVQTQKNMDTQIGKKPEFEWAYKYEIDSWGLYEHEIEEFFDVQKYLLQHSMNYEKIIEMEDVKRFLSEMNKYNDEVLQVISTFANAINRIRREGLLRNSNGEEVYVYPYVTEDDHQKDFVPIFKKMNEGLEQGDYLENINLFMNE